MIEAFIYITLAFGHEVVEHARVMFSHFHARSALTETTEKDILEP